MSCNIKNLTDVSRIFKGIFNAGRVVIRSAHSARVTLNAADAILTFQRWLED